MVQRMENHGRRTKKVMLRITYTLTDLVVRIQHVSDNLKNILHVSAPEEVKYVPGIQHMYESLISIDAPPEKTYLGHQYVCLEVDNSREVVSHSGVYVQPAISAGAHCFADVSYNFSNEALHTVCLQADEKDGETRCFTLDIIGHSNDPCISNPCQNIGICLRKDNSTFKCICGEEYTGSNCERAIPDEVKHPNNDNSTFTDVFLPTEIVCVKNKPCVIPFVVSGIYSFPSKPTVDVGYVSPSIEINGISPLEQKSSTNATYISEIMFTPTVPGKQKICLQTLSQNRINLDEICFNVDVRTDALILFGDKDKPHFTPPSITMNSTVVCKTGVPCHMVFRVSSGRSHENNCSSMKVVEGLTEHYHIFSDCETCTDGPSAVSNCTMDLVFNPTHITHFRLCLEAQLKWRDVTGEVRCFDINVVGDNYNFSGPCSRLHCMNGGFCDAENAGGVHPVCHCPIGFSGIRCESDEPPSISNNTNRPSVGNLALPVEIYCNYNESCSIPFLLLGQPHNIPFVGPGHIPPAITVENLVIDSTHSTGKQFEGYLQIRLMGNATQPVCIQSKSGNSTNRVLEEICFKVQVGEGQLYGPPVDKSRPHYIDPTLPDRSTVLCKTGSECHILMYTSKTSSNCPTVSETQDYTDGLHIFLAASRNGYDCVIDISYIPPKTMQGQKKMCLQVSLPGFKGEVRCYVVISLEKANLSTGLCINKECNNGGHCDSNVQEARCICRVGHGGDMCTGSSKFVEPQNVPPNMQLTESPVFTDLAVPDTLICYVRLECWLPIIINGNTSPNKPTLKFGYMDTDWTAGTQMLDGGTVNGVYSGSVSFRPTTLGEYPFCIQTAISASQHISDEICCIVKVLDPSRKPTELPFQSPTLNANSAVKCQVNTTCHILSYLIQVNGQCPELIQTSVVENVFVFSPDKTENKCVIDTAFIPSSSQMVATSSTTSEMTSSTTVTSSTSTTSQSPETSSTQATSQPTTAISTKVTSLYIKHLSQEVLQLLLQHEQNLSQQVLQLFLQHEQNLSQQVLQLLQHEQNLSQQVLQLLLQHEQNLSQQVLQLLLQHEQNLSQQVLQLLLRQEQNLSQQVLQLLLQHEQPLSQQVLQLLLQHEQNLSQQVLQLLLQHEQPLSQQILQLLNQHEQHLSQQVLQLLLQHEQHLSQEVLQLLLQPH
ncbi:hypothetical protein ACJMK2_037373 [Sinanodonta woodiana]|uniref:EGF-like domain-containing protein n=1 Tax=Sinanodonta woodiana TaxID=1069815 RepID=A0ABD3WPD8_SINWO